MTPSGRDVVPAMMPLLPAGTATAPVPAPPVGPARLSALQDLLAGYLLSKRGATRTAYAADLRSWLAWCTDHGIDPLAAGLHHADAYLRTLDELGDSTTRRRLAPSTIARRVSAVHGFSRYAVAHRGVTESPFTAATRPRVDDESMTSGLTRTEVRALLAAAEAHSPRSEALIALLVLNGLRITEALSARIEDLDYDRGHRVLRITRKGGHRAKTSLTPAVLRAIHAATAGRTTGPIFATRTGRALNRTVAWRLIRRLAATAGIPGAARISPHSMRHTFATTALDAGVPLRAVQDSMGNADPRTTRLYDRTRASLDRNASYAVAAHLA